MRDQVVGRLKLGDGIMSKLSATIHRGIIALAISFSFMFFVYAPLEVYLGNTTEFWFDITNLGPIVMICFLIACVLLIFVQELLYKFLYPKNKNTKRAFYIIYTAMLLIFVGLYIQGNYIPRDYGVLDGSTIDWKAYTSFGIASIVLWLAIAFVGVILWIKCRKWIFKIGQGVSTVIFIMLTGALISLVWKAEDIVDNSRIIVTDEGKWTLSENKNIYVLVLDTFDAEYLRILLEENEEQYSEMLEDFTFYSNAVGGYPTTKGAIPLILTGKWYENDIPFKEYVNGNGLELFETLKENNYSVGVYTNPLFINKGEKDYYQNVYSGKYKAKEPVDFAILLYKLIAFEYLPHQFKSAFWVNTNDFESLKALEGEGIKANSVSDEEFYKIMCSDGFQLTSETNCFRFIHLWGMHPPYAFGENVVEDGGEYTYLDAAKGSMNEVKALIANLKESGVYNNTAIMILADHGGGDLASELNCNPLLLVKGFDEHHGFIVSEKPISGEDIYPTLLSWAGEEEEDNAVWNIPDKERERRFLYYIWDNATGSAYLPIMHEYSITGNVSDKTADIIPTGKQFIPDMVESSEIAGVLLPDTENQNLFIDDPFKIEIPIDSESETFQSMYVSGLGKIETGNNGKKYAWSNGYYTHFKLNPNGKQNVPYTFTINFEEIYNEGFNDEESLSTAVRKIYATVNGEKVEYDEITESSISFIIPQETLSADVVDVMIFYPYFDNGNEDDKALAITSVVLEQKFPANVEEDSFTMEFNQSGYLKNTVAYGWYSEAEGAVWSAEDAEIWFLASNDSDLIMSIGYNVSMLVDSPTVIKLNGHVVCTLGQQGGKEIVLPKEYLNPSIQVLEFLSDVALSPEEAGISTDTRILGIYVQNLTIIDSKALLPIGVSFQSNSNTAEYYMVSGFSIPESWGTWMVGPEASMSFLVPDVQNNLLLTLECPIAYGEQHVSVYVNDVLVEESVFNGNETRSILIPMECMTDDRLNIRFVLPDASSPKEKGEGTEERELAIGITGLKIEKIE